MPRPDVRVRSEARDTLKRRLVSAEPAFRALGDPNDYVTRVLKMSAEDVRIEAARAGRELVDAARALLAATEPKPRGNRWKGEDEDDAPTDPADDRCDRCGAKDGPTHVCSPGMVASGRWPKPR